MFTRLLVGLGSSMLALAQVPALTDAQIQSAIDRGRRKESAIVTVSGILTPAYKVLVTGPLGFIANKAERALITYQPFALADVTDADKSPTVYVWIVCKTPEITPYRTAIPPSVQHVVLQATKGAVAVQPLTTTPVPQEWTNNTGGRITCDGMHATFPLDQVPAGAFDVVVVSVTNNEIRVKVKPEHRQKGMF